MRSSAKIALPFATTGIAATLLEGGRTVHSGFKLPVPIVENSVSGMRLHTKEADQLRKAELIIIDEVTMLTKHGLGCIDRLLRDIMQSDQPFGGKTFVIGGDFRQTLPVVPRGTQTDVIQSCIKSSGLWRYFKCLSLATNMRSENARSHNEWLLKVGSGTLAECPSLPINSVIVPESMLTSGDLITEIFSADVGSLSIADLAKRVILAPTNKDILAINNTIIQSLPGLAQPYYSVDSVVSEDPTDSMNFPAEFLHQQTPSGMPPHLLLLKVGAIVMLIRNLNSRKGLCNGTRLIVRSVAEHLITAQVLAGSHQGDVVIIPRIDLAPSDSQLPFVLKRRQLPIIPAFAMTINKSQGQTFDFVGVQLQEPVFAHGQLYVALSRARLPANIRVAVTKTPLQGQLLADSSDTFTQNIVYREVI